MLVRVRIDLSDAERATSSRVVFWDEFLRLARGRSGESGLRDDARLNERSIYDRLPYHLVRYLSQDPYELEPSFTRRVGRVFGLGIRIKVRSISYGSMDCLLEVSGVSKDASEDAILSLLEMYLPDAVNDVFGTSVAIGASVTKVGEDAAVEATRAARIQRLITSTFLLPIGLTLGVCYLVFAEMRKEMELLKAREDKIITESAGIFRALLEQNARLSTAILDRALEENRRLRSIVDISKPGDQKPSN